MHAFDRFIVSEYISDTLLMFEASHKEATKQLLFIPAPFEHSHLIVEVRLVVCGVCCRQAQSPPPSLRSSLLASLSLLNAHLVLLRNGTSCRTVRLSPRFVCLLQTIFQHMFALPRPPAPAQYTTYFGTALFGLVC